MEYIKVYKSIQNYTKLYTLPSKNLSDVYKQSITPSKKVKPPP